MRAQFGSHCPQEIPRQGTLAKLVHTARLFVAATGVPSPVMGGWDSQDMSYGVSGVPGTTASDLELAVLIESVAGLFYYRRLICRDECAYVNVPEARWPSVLQVD
jgi:hypothetical protein